MDKEDKQSLLLWGIVAYSVVLLLYCTSKTLIGADADSISAFGSFLSAIATIYATYVVIKLYAHWTDPHKASFYVNECKDDLKPPHPIPLKNTSSTLSSTSSELKR